MIKNIGKYYVRMNENETVVSAGLTGGLVYYTYFPRNAAEAKKIFNALCADVENW